MQPTPDVPTGYSVFRFADTDEFSRLLKGAGLAEVAIEEHKTTHLIPDVETLWRGGLGSFALTASAIAHQAQIRRAKFERHWNEKRLLIKRQTE